MPEPRERQEPDQISEPWASMSMADFTAPPETAADRYARILRQAGWGAPDNGAPADVNTLVNALRAEHGLEPVVFLPRGTAPGGLAACAEQAAAEEPPVVDGDQAPEMEPEDEPRETLPEYLARAYPDGGPVGMLAVRLVPVAVFGADECDQCQARQGYGLRDAAECWSDCNSARGHIYRRDEEWMHRRASECIVVWVHPGEAGTFDQVLGDQRD